MTLVARPLTDPQRTKIGEAVLACDLEGVTQLMFLLAFCKIDQDQAEAAFVAAVELAPPEVQAWWFAPCDCWADEPLERYRHVQVWDDVDPGLAQRPYGPER